MRIASGTDVGLAFVDGTADGFDALDGFDGIDGFDAHQGLDTPDGFEERLGGGPAIAGCGCPHCAARPRTARPARPSGGGRIHRAVRTACLATTVLAGAGVVGLTAGAGAAQAAPGKQGWDGSKYWFKNARGEWRWTGHYSVYTKAVGGSGSSSSSAASSTTGAPTGSASPTGSTGSTVSTAQPAAPEGAVRSAGPRQGWDGSRYWFRNARGEWRWTSHYDIYLDRTGRSGGGTPAPDQTPSSDRAESVIGYALAQLGKPYVWGGDGPSGYDCSGLVQQAFRRAGVALPRVADDQYAATTPIAQDRLRRGDLLFWSDSGRASGIHHVGIYLGGGKFVEAPRPGKTVRVSTISSGFRPTHFGRP
ncbi:C40 family peptidase [Kitasatospora purpeofusca]|uniref:C40 family peptidase n=1 Tax=Kitasatospora purpeofusca TaxID=67352 RepID=A0ABZ1U148_9ACTN|nr:C40 family peptidase [Kitasatospora purpeofusca]